MNKPLHTLLLGAAALLLPVSCHYAPEPGYEGTPQTLSRRDGLVQDFIAMLPKDQQEIPAARKEAFWLADTAFKASASIARINNPCFTAWLNNRMVNSRNNWRERGLCWHYQHDMFRELRRRPLKYFRLGCTVRDEGRGAEHHCVYVTPKQQVWPHVIVLDAWKKNGRLYILDEKALAEDDWEEEANVANWLSMVYPENHPYPVEHWAMVRQGKRWGEYVYFDSPEGKTSRQGKLMWDNMKKGLQERKGKLTNY